MGLARPTGFEPATCSFGGCHSIQLSYERDQSILLHIPRCHKELGELRSGQDLGGFIATTVSQDPPAFSYGATLIRHPL